jgi:hypothetical protein
LIRNAFSVLVAGYQQPLPDVGAHIEEGALLGVGLEEQDLAAEGTAFLEPFERLSAFVVGQLFVHQTSQNDNGVG